jgi:hypothetical protein
MLQNPCHLLHGNDSNSKCLGQVSQRSDVRAGFSGDRHAHVYPATRESSCRLMEEPCCESV